MTNSLIDARSRRVLNTLGCSVENSYSAYHYYREDSGEKYAKKGIEHLRNAKIIDPEFSMLSPEAIKIKDAFPNKNDPIYQPDDDLPKGVKRQNAYHKRAKNNCSIIAAHLITVNLSRKRGTKLRHFYDSESVRKNNIYRTEVS